ncbi:MAG: hypothetical protein RLZZ450_5222 [Pseudomonadota bacterium]
MTEVESTVSCPAAAAPAWGSDGERPETERREAAAGFLASASIPLSASYAVYACAVLASALGLRPFDPVPARIMLGAMMFAMLLALSRVFGIRRASSPVLGSTVLERTGAVVWTFGCLITALNALIAWYLPIGGYDALGYRLPAAGQWLDAGRVAWVQSDDALRNGYALGLEVLEALVTAATSSTAALEVLALCFVLAGASALGALALLLGWPRGAARVAGGLFLLVPIHILNGSSGYVDAAFAGACVASLVLSAAWAFDLGRPGCALVVATGVASGWLVALKSHGVAFVGLILASALLVRVARHGLRATLPAAGLLATLCMPGGFFLLRNVVIAHNPLYPVEIRLGGRVLFPGTGSLDAVLSTASNVPEALRGLPAWLRPLYVWLQLHGPAVELDERLSGLGYAFPLLALPASAWLLVRVASSLARFDRGGRGLFSFARGRTARDLFLLARGKTARVDAVLSLVFGATLACFVVQPLAFWSRYTSWLWGFGALAVAALVHLLSRTAASRAQQRTALAVALLAMTLVPAEATYALAHVKRLDRDHRELLTGDTVRALATLAGVDAGFVREELMGRAHVCRTPWRVGTDDANLDGVAAQLSPRPSAHVISDSSLDRALASAHRAGCATLIAFGNSPLPAEARARALDVRERRAFGVVQVIELPRSEQTPY